MNVTKKNQTEDLPCVIEEVYVKEEPQETETGGGVREAAAGVGLYNVKLDVEASSETAQSPSTQDLNVYKLPPIYAFDYNGDSHTVGTRWEKWKRSLEIYFVASSIDKPDEKRDVLFEMGGAGLKEIYLKILNANEDKDTATDVYRNAIKKLDKYFLVKSNKVYERYIFRLLKQESNERFEAYLLRLRHQSKKCGFIDEEENLVDQILDKCNSIGLKRKILSLGDTVSLDKIINEARAVELLERYESISNIDNESSHENYIHTYTHACIPKRARQST